MSDQHAWRVSKKPMFQRLAEDGLSARYEAWLIFALLLGGVGMRLAWLYAHVRSAGGVFLPSITEGQRVGVALATSNHFADPFSAPSGATAHLSPFFPFLIGLIYRIFGVATERAEIVLSVLSILLVSLSFYLCFRVFRKLGASWLACIAGLAVAALLPLQVNLEASELRVWESPLLIVGILALLLWALRLDEKALVSWKVVMTMAVAAGLLILVNPVGALSAYAIIAVLIVTRAPRRRWLPFGAALAFTGLLVATPWAWRNHEILGRTIWTRSNAGLELALAYNDTMYSGRDGRAAYLARLEQIHPAKGPRGMAALQRAGGEISYSRSLSDETWTWISRNPAPAASLVARHARDYLLPPTWFFNTFGADIAKGTAVRALIMCLSAVFGLLALPFLIGRDRRYLYLAAAITPLILPYIVVQPILRYRYLISTIVLFLAFDALVRCLQTIRGWSTGTPVAAVG